MDEFNDGIRRLGSLPKDAFDADRTQSSKQLMATIAKCQQELQGLTHVNKKALDQFANFSDQRDRLIERQAELDDLTLTPDPNPNPNPNPYPSPNPSPSPKQAELDEAEASIRELIEHLDHKKEEAIERTFKLASRHYLEVSP